MRTKAYSTLSIPLLATICLMGFVDTAAANNNKKGALAKAEIEELMSCYAYSFDSIARAVDAIYTDGPLDVLDERNLEDPNFAEGYERFRNCTTDDFVIEILTLNGDLVLPEGAIPAGPLPWVNLVNFFNRNAPPGQNPTVNSQHLFGSFSTTVDKREGTVVAYASITGYTMDGKDEPGTSTYTSDVVYKRGKWLLKKTSFVEN